MRSSLDTPTIQAKLNEVEFVVFWELTVKVNDVGVFPIVVELPLKALDEGVRQSSRISKNECTRVVIPKMFDDGVKVPHIICSNL